MGEELNRLEQLFHAAAELATPEAKAEYLARACGGDTVLRERVEKLLRAHETAGQFLDAETPPILNGLPFGELDPGPAEKPGDKVGPYTLVEQIGEGSCCVVYRAEQAEPVRREVALKLVKAGMDTRQVVARFEAERQALALMDHPHIARVFDAGVTTSGRPYFAMELVRGIPITQYCDEHQLTVKQRLELFLQVCHAVQHAHQKGIIHRDLKPSNILVPTNHDPAAPKIIDFGIAKAIQGPLTDRAVVTWVGQFVGTPAYMSPEQAGMSSEDIDARADIYSLGALLYELLTGATPFDGEKLGTAAFDEIRRMIQETEPPKPSARLHNLVAADVSPRKPTGGSAIPTAEEISADLPRRLRSKEQIRLLRGDLDWIVMKALEKDRQRRYGTATGLAEDIQRHLAHEPVLAGPPSAVYRARKFVRRHRAGVVVCLAVTLALVGGLSLALVGRHRALLAEQQMRLQRDRAMQAESDARVILDLLNDKLSSGDEMIALLHASARIARERLGPTNPAVLKIVLSSAQNLGRLAAWTNALEVYRWLIEIDPGNLELWERAHAAALAGAQPDTGRQLRDAMVKRFAASRDPANCLALARTLLVAPEYQRHLDTARDCANRAYQARSNDLPCRTMQGLAAYRQGNWSETLQLLQDAKDSPEPSLAALAAAFGAMARHQAGDEAGARAVLDQVSRHLRGPLQMGQLQAKDWHKTVLALAARAEAEHVVLGREVSPPLTAGFLAVAKETWKSLHESLAQGEAFAREAEWKESRDAYVRVLAHPLFNWTEAEEQSLGRCLSLEMGAVFARCSDSTNHERLCRLLLARHPEKPTTPKEESDATVMANRYARACFVFARNLSPELRQDALELARFALANQRRRNDHSRQWVCQTTGIAEYYAGQLERAAELLLEAEANPMLAIKGPAMLYRAMASKKLNRSQEAAQALHDAELLSGSPELNRREWWFNGELYRLALEEARQVIRGEAK